MDKETGVCLDELLEYVACITSDFENRLAGSEMMEIHSVQDT